MTMTPSDFRAEIGRRRLVIYQLAAAIDVYPGRLGRMLNERVAMTDVVADRLEKALERRWPGTEGDKIG